MSPANGWVDPLPRAFLWRKDLRAPHVVQRGVARSRQVLVCMVMLSRVSEMESTQIEQTSLSYHRHVVLPKRSGVHLRVEVHARRQPAISLQIVSDAADNTAPTFQRSSGSGGSAVGPGEGSH